MSDLVTLEEKIKNILGDDFVLKEVVNAVNFPNPTELLFVHKSETRRIAIEICKPNGEQEKITQIILLKKISKTSRVFKNYERYSYGIKNKQEIPLINLKKVKIKMCLMQVFQ